MKVTIKHFALCHDLFGRREETRELPEGTRVEDVLRLLEAEQPRLAELRPILRVSVNWEYASPETSLRDGDEIALIPPVSGG